MTKSTIICSSVIILLTIGTIPLTTSGQATNSVTIRSHPQEVDNYSHNQIINLTSGPETLNIPTIITGPNYYHIMKLSILDDINPIFSEEWYKFEIEIDLDLTIFDPEPMIFSLEDGSNFSIPLSNKVYSNTYMNFQSIVYSLSNRTTRLEIQMQLITYLIPSEQYNFNTTIYHFQTNPVDTIFEAKGTYSWTPLATTYLFLDRNLNEIESIVDDYKLSLLIKIGNVVSGQTSDRIRLSVNGYSVSERVNQEMIMEFQVSYNPVMVIDVFTLSDLLSFEILSVSFVIDMYQPQGEMNPIEIPFYSIFIAIFLNFLSYIIIKKMNEADLRWSDK